MAGKPRSVCEMGVYCIEHGHVHGAEAEQLRQRITELRVQFDTIGTRELDRLLDSVDARDSLAYLEGKVRRRRRGVPTRRLLSWLARSPTLLRQLEDISAERVSFKLETKPLERKTKAGKKSK